MQNFGMLSINARDAQKRVLVQMLSDLGGGNSNWGGNQMQVKEFKALIYDNAGLDVLNPLLKIYFLKRDYGVTFHGKITTERSEIPDLPVVYIVEPTEANLTMIVKDCQKGLYHQCHVNFLSTIPRDLLKKFAFQLHECGAQATHRVVQVVDRYMNFVALAPHLISLNIPQAYSTLNSRTVTDYQIEQTITSIVDSLLSVVATMGLGVPIIRCPPDHSSVAKVVAEKLEQKMRDMVNSGHDIFGGAGDRPLLALLDRDLDIATVLHHTWTYQAMCHDLLGMKSNMLTCQVDNDNPAAGADAQKIDKTYDIDPNDPFWVEHHGDVIFEMFAAVQEEVKQYEQKKEEMKGRDISAKTVGELKDMTDRKSSVDMHTNIGIAILNHMKARQLDGFYAAEDAFPSQSINAAFAEADKLCSTTGTVDDKTRLLLVLYLTKKNMTDPQFDQLSAILTGKVGGNPQALHYLKHLVSRVKSSQIGREKPSNLGDNLSNIQENVMKGNLAGVLGGILGGTADAALKTMKQIIPSKRECVCAEIMGQLMENEQDNLQGNQGAAGGPGGNRGGPGGFGALGGQVGAQLGVGGGGDGERYTSKYIYLDPKIDANMYRNPDGSTIGRGIPKVRGAFKRGIVCVVGGGNFVEAKNIRDACGGKEVLYCTTDFTPPNDFLAELQALGG